MSLTGPQTVPSASAWRSTHFLSFVAGDVLLNFGEEMIVVAVGWLVYARTGSAFALGLVGLAGFLPTFLLPMLSGTVVDRCDRRTVLIVASAVPALGTLALCLSTEYAAVWPIYAVAVSVGCAKSFLNAGTKAVMPGLVATGDLSRALAVAGMIGEGAKLIGPMLGGLLFAWGPIAPFAGAFLVLGLATVSWIGLGPRPPQGESERPNWHSLTSGYRFILVQPIILGAMTLDLVAVLLGGVTALLPIYVGQIFLVGPWALGLLRTAPAIGAIVMGLVLTWRPLQRHVGRSLMIAVAVYGVATIGFGLSTSLPVAIVFLAILGAADTVSQVIRGSLVQLATPDHMRGRVSAVYSMITGTSNELGEFESGMLAAAVGAVPAVVLGGVAAIAAAIAWQWLFPTLASADHLEQPPEDAEPVGV